VAKGDLREDIAARLDAEPEQEPVHDREDSG
jgi:hypothetical protein